MPCFSIIPYSRTTSAAPSLSEPTYIKQISVRLPSLAQGPQRETHHTPGDDERDREDRHRDDKLKLVKGGTEDVKRLRGRLSREEEVVPEGEDERLGLAPPGGGDDVRDAVQLKGGRA